jgi:hypothetical protein
VLSFLCDLMGKRPSVCSEMCNNQRPHEWRPGRTQPLVQAHPTGMVLQSQMMNQWWMTQGIISSTHRPTEWFRRCWKEKTGRERRFQTASLKPNSQTQSLLFQLLF